MANWALVEGRLADGLPMRLYLAEHDGKLWSVSIADDEHPSSESDFVSGLDRGPGLHKRLHKGIDWQRRERRTPSDPLGRVASEVEEYFAGRSLQFSIPLFLSGTPFQVRVWQKLLQIPFGATRTYGELAAAVDHPTAFRAVGAANGRNRLPLFVPCHRVIAARGKLCGFTGGVGLKRRLLAHEAAISGCPVPREHTMPLFGSPASSQRT